MLVSEMKTYTTLLCYMNGAIITCPNNVCYSCLPIKAVVTNTDTIFDELETNVCLSLSVDCL